MAHMADILGILQKELDVHERDLLVLVGFDVKVSVACYVSSAIMLKASCLDGSTAMDSNLLFVINEERVRSVKHELKRLRSVAQSNSLSVRLPGAKVKKAGFCKLFEPMLADIIEYEYRLAALVEDTDGRRQFVQDMDALCHEYRTFISEFESFRVAFDLVDHVSDSLPDDLRPFIKGELSLLLSGVNLSDMLDALHECAAMLGVDKGTLHGGIVPLCSLPQAEEKSTALRRAAMTDSVTKGLSTAGRPPLEALSYEYVCNVLRERLSDACKLVEQDHKTYGKGRFFGRLQMKSTQVKKLEKIAADVLTDPVVVRRWSLTDAASRARGLKAANEIKNDTAPCRTRPT
jgi:hypothetical protein